MATLSGQRPPESPEAQASIELGGHPGTVLSRLADSRYIDNFWDAVLDTPHGCSVREQPAPVGPSHMDHLGTKATPGTDSPRLPHGMGRLFFRTTDLIAMPCCEPPVRVLAVDLLRGLVPEC